MANRFHNKQIKSQAATKAPPSPGLGKTQGSLGKDGTENWTNKGGSNVFGKGTGGYKKIKVHAVSSN